MRIFYVKGSYDFCYFYRGLLPGIHSGQMVMQFGEDTDVKRAMEADTVVFQRPSDPNMLKLALLLKQSGRKVIFENDDSYSLGKGILPERLESDRQREIARGLDDSLTSFLRHADGAIASTEFLAEEFRKTNPNVAVLKNCIDPDDAMPCKKNTTGKYRVGFIGSVTTNDDYLHVRDAIRRLDERGDVTIVVFGIKHAGGEVISFMADDLAFWSSLKNIEWQPYVHVTEYMATLADLALDLAIIPRQDSYFNRCKSNLKFLEMSLLGIPVIAQGFPDGKSPYQNEDDARHMIIVNEGGDWYNAVVDAIKNPVSYKEMAESAREYVLLNYNIRTYAEEWTNTIQRLCK